MTWQPPNVKYTQHWFLWGFFLPPSSILYSTDASQPSIYMRQRCHQRFLRSLCYGAFVPIPPGSEGGHHKGTGIHWFHQQVPKKNSARHLVGPPPKSPLLDGLESVTGPRGARGRRDQRRLSKNGPRRQARRPQTPVHPGAATRVFWRPRRHFIQTGHPPPCACDAHASATSAPPGTGRRPGDLPSRHPPRDRGPGRGPSPGAVAESPARSPGRRRLPHSPSVATVPASKSKQSPRPRASRRMLLSPEASSRPSSRSPLLKAMGARPAAAAPRAPATSRSFTSRPRRRPAQAPPRPPPRRLLCARARRPGQVRARGRLPASRPAQTRRRAPPSGQAVVGGLRARSGANPGPGCGGEVPLRWAAVRKEDSTHSSARRRLQSAGRPNAPETLQDARGLIWAAGAWPAPRCWKPPGPPLSSLVLPVPLTPPSLVYFCDHGRVPASLGLSSPTGEAGLETVPTS